VLLLGFADATGTPQKNVELSKDRATRVSEQFSQRGVQPATIAGFGAEMPVASNETEDGRQKNRRVEIWVKK
jgi:phosphate transport system substrate-binding protein